MMRMLALSIVDGASFSYPHDSETCPDLTLIWDTKLTI